MTDDTSNIRLRIPNALLAKISEIAAKNQRSVNAEILARVSNAYEWEAIDPNDLAGELDEIDRRFAVLFTHLGLLDLGEDPRVELQWRSHAPKGNLSVKEKSDEPAGKGGRSGAAVSATKGAAKKPPAKK